MRLAYTPAAMPARPLRPTDRTEARRRARLAARGDEDVGEEAELEPAVAQQRQGLLERLIPPAPALPGKGDPLAGFDYNGPLRSVVTGLYLLRRNPIAWLGPGLVYVLGLEIGLIGREQDITFLIVQLLQYVALAAAGWVGWQRPWLFGMAAALLGITGSTVLLAYLARMATSSHFDPLAYLLSEALFYAALGLIAGWYGGYLRRRLAGQRAPQPAARARRR